ncbi:MAG: serine/threonine-protein kinase, partial [Myxococcota bacterium]|nr:serine/threonine-protein kinase [Myxococcota bacterium]
VALKVLSPPPHASREDVQAFQQRFLLEAKTLASLSHPNIVVVFDYGEIGPGSFYIAMEYVEGKRYSDVLRERPFDPARNLSLCFQVCQALQYAHRRGVIHRDIKNSNILVKEEETGPVVKVVDFGIVKLVESDPELTQNGVILGSPHFMAPEQARGGQVTHRTDQYAVGVMLFCGLVGRYPFDGPNSTAILTSHVIDPVPAFREKNPRCRVAGDLEAVVMRTLSKEAGARFEDMAGLMTALKPFVDGVVSVEPGTRPDVPTESHAPVPAARPTSAAARPEGSIDRYRAVVVGLLALILVALGVLVGVVLARSSEGPGSMAPPVVGAAPG